MWRWLLVITCFIIVPLLINIMFKYDFGICILQAEWEAGDALAFYGVILAAILAVYGVYMTIGVSNNNYKDNLRNNVLPFFSVYNLKTKSRKNMLFVGLNGNNDKSDDKETQMDTGYHEYKIQDYYYILNEGVIEIKDGLTQKQKELLESGGFIWRTNNGVSMLTASDHICHPMEIENVGNGAAISFRIGFNRKKDNEKDWKYTYGIPVKVGEKIMIHIFSEDCGKQSQNLGEYVLDFQYKDIYGNKYSQMHDIKIEYLEDMKVPCISILYEERQNYLKENDYSKNQKSNIS